MIISLIDHSFPLKSRFVAEGICNLCIMHNFYNKHNNSGLKSKKTIRNLDSTNYF